MPWLALSLQVDAVAAETMSEALLELGADSVTITNVDAPRPTVAAVLPLQTDAARLVAAAAAMAGLSAAPAFSLSELPDQDWVRSTQAQFSPIEIGERLWVGPHWHQPPPGRIAVRLDPGLAFGTGTHPTTRLMLSFLERCVRGGERVLDYGCGSGILAIAAAKLGAAAVDAVDIDPQAVETAAGNARANAVALRIALPEDLAATHYDIVVSNILAQPLIVLAPLLVARTRRMGQLALAGILDSQAAEVQAAYAPWMKLAVTERDGPWALLAGARA